MNEFFTLTCQSIKLNSPHMNTICHIDTNQLYRKAQNMNVPFFKWASWIEAYLNKEFMRAVLAKNRAQARGGSKPPTNKTFIKAEQATKSRMLDQAKFFNQELEAHKKHKGKDKGKEEKKKDKTSGKREADAKDAKQKSAKSEPKKKNAIQSMSLFQ